MSALVLPYADTRGGEMPGGQLLPFFCENIHSSSLLLLLTPGKRFKDFKDLLFQSVQDTIKKL